MSITRIYVTWHGVIVVYLLSTEAAVCASKINEYMCILF